MSAMVDGLARPGVHFSAPPSPPVPRAVRYPTPLMPQRRPGIVDLRPPRRQSNPIAGMTSVAAGSSVVAVPEIPFILPIPAQRPLSPLLWLAAGGATAALIAGSVMIISHTPNRAFRQHLNAKSLAGTAEAAKPPTLPSASAASIASGQVTSTQIQTLLNNFAAQAGAPVYLVVKDLKTGEGGSIGADQTLTSASLYKLFVAKGIYNLIDDDKLSLTSSVPGTGENVEDCLKAMITVSDNTCGEGLEGMLGYGNYDNTLSQEGYTHTDWSQIPVVSSASDVALLYQRLYNGTLLSPNATEMFLNLLKDQQVNNRLPQGLPAGTVIAHKTGDLDAYLHDAGIIYGPKTDFLVVMMSGPWSDLSVGPTQFANLSSQLYKLFEQ